MSEAPPLAVERLARRLDQVVDADASRAEGERRVDGTGQ
jgi:hypothetical protein